MALWKKIICGVLAVLLVGIGAVAFVMRDEISAVFTGLRYSSEELEQKLEETEQTINDTTQIVPDFTVRDLTEEEKQELEDGTITMEELIDRLVQPAQAEEQAGEDTKSSSSVPSNDEQTKPGVQTQGAVQTQQKPGTQVPAQSQSDKGAQTTNPSHSKPGTQAPAQSAAGRPQVSDYQKQLASMIAEVYVLRSEFLIALDNLLGQAKAEYLSIPSGERKAKLSSLAGKYFTRAYGLESQCDARMGAIVDRMEALLKANGGDLSIAQTVYDTYLSEKSLKKSWYLAELRKRGI